MTARGSFGGIRDRLEVWTRGPGGTWLGGEVTRLCVSPKLIAGRRGLCSPVASSEGDAPAGACSMLYGACWRAARALGYRRLLTYILDTEVGLTLRAAGWHCIGEAGGGSWSRPSRQREGQAPQQGKLRWHAGPMEVAE